MPNRVLKESIKCSDTIDRLTWFQEVTFYRLMVTVDDFGRFYANPVILCNELFMTKEDVTKKAVADAVARLEKVGLINIYRADGKEYLQIAKWEKHQSIRCKKSKFPAPDQPERMTDRSRDRDHDRDPDRNLHADESRCEQISEDENICMQMNADEFRCMQMNSDACKCSRNPIQSESNPNPNPKDSAELPQRSAHPPGDDVQDNAQDNAQNDAQDIAQDNVQDDVQGGAHVGAPAVIRLPILGGEYGVTQDQIDEWEKAYPAVGIIGELRKMREWLISNPKKRKTQRGIRNFITSWLAREQDKGGYRARSGTLDGARAAGSAIGKRVPAQDYHQRESYANGDYTELEREMNRYLRAKEGEPA